VLALLASVLVVAYLVIPGALFRTAFSFFVPLRAFDRTRTQEFEYSVAVCVAPLALALGLVWFVGPFGRHPMSFPDSWAQRTDDYRTLLLNLYSDKFDLTTPDACWAAISRVARRQGRLLFWYYVLTALEGLIVGGLAARWGTIQPRLPKGGLRDRLGARFLLRNINEWHVLLTDFMFPGTTMHVDVMAAEDRLYRGRVLSHTVNKDGSLTGLYLTDAQRYNRRGYVADTERGTARSRESYWTSIPGNRLFIFGDKLVSLNIRPETTFEAAVGLARDLRADIEVTVEETPVDVPGDADSAS
jgi:hypothetical protein